MKDKIAATPLPIGQMELQPISKFIELSLAGREMYTPELKIKNEALDTHLKSGKYCEYLKVLRPTLHECKDPPARE